MVLLTGATGLLGRVLLMKLLEKGKKVRALRQSTSNIKEVELSLKDYGFILKAYEQSLEWVVADFQDVESLEKMLFGVEEVYHTAAVVSFDPSREDEVFSLNILGTKNLLYAMDSKKVDRLLFVSSIAVFDGLNSQNEIDEDSQFNPKMHHSAYARSKHFAEMEVFRAMAEGLQAVIINPGVIIGSGNWKRSSGQLFSSALRIPFITSGIGSFVDVRDVASIAVELMEKESFGEKYIVVSENIPYREFMNSIRKTYGIKEAKVISESITKLLFNILRFFSFLSPSLKNISKDSIAALFSKEIVSNRKVKEHLNYNFISVQESIDFHLRNFKSSDNK